ncbi:alpha/beta hydrolase [Acholeplasma sp. OttesenSCG-928-E16]|nr:alpha/beta hydrolase [Acholeplasma sp. OttesenSCG-928-E16]
MEIKLNNISINYEEYNNGFPLIFLHGNNESLSIFKDVPSLLKENRIFLIDSRGHGKSSKNVSINYHLMAEDVIEFIKKKEIKKPTIIGFSDGAIVSLLISIKEKELLNKQVLMGVNINPKGIKNRYLFLMKLGYLFNKDPLSKMMINEPNISLSELNLIKTPTLILSGSKDIIKESHTKLIASNINNSVLKILNKETHISYVIDNQKLVNYIQAFIK